MTKQERAKLAALLTEAHRLQYANPPPTQVAEFHRGYTHGVEKALEAAGFTWCERYAIWERVMFAHELKGD